MGPTAPYVYPVPRDYRPGKFKFTSTGYGLKPSRLDLTRSIADGLDGTSMPAFSAQLTPEEIQQVIDYVLYLSMRGETEVAFALEASAYEDADAELFDAPLQDELAYSVFERWRESAEPTPATAPASPRPEPTAESIERGRQLFLGTTTDVKLECVTCHGPRGDGAGSSWVDPETFNRYVFGGKPGAEQLEKLRDYADKNGGKKWSDDWGNPLRPADLNKGIYKGGRRPIDLYWRIANGITGTPMPAHASALTDPDDLWHLVNFILALPHDSKLLLPRPAETGLAAAPEPPSTSESTD
jgi:mono/diheme cytochrome c family protein